MDEAEERNASSSDALAAEEVLMGGFEDEPDAAAALVVEDAAAAAAAAAEAPAAVPVVILDVPAAAASPGPSLPQGSPFPPGLQPYAPRAAPPADHQHLVSPTPVWVAPAPAAADSHSPAHRHAQSVPVAPLAARAHTPLTLLAHQRASLGLLFYKSSHTPVMSPEMSRAGSPSCGMRRVASRSALTKWDSELWVDVIEARGLSLDGSGGTAEPDVVVKVKLAQSPRENPLGLGETMLAEDSTRVARASSAPRWKDAHFDKFRFEYSFFSSDRLVLRLEVWGANPATHKSAVIGQATLTIDDDLADGQLFDEWVPLLPWYRQRGEARGRLHVRAAFRSCESLALEQEAASAAAASSVKGRGETLDI